MIRIRLLFILLPVLLLLSFLPKGEDDSRIFSFQCKPNKYLVAMHWRNTDGKVYGNLDALLADPDLHPDKMVFAMNGGMYQTDNSPLGLYIEKGKQITPINKRTGKGNFYLKPNGVFYLTSKNKAEIVKTEDFVSTSSIRYATQSGPMLVIDGMLHPEFKKGSENLNIRNGVGVLPDGGLLFAVSVKPVNFYDFAIFFKNKGCNNALYLDGFVSKMYCPEKGIKELDGNLGVLISVSR